jgi:hypothetical protein
MSVEVDMKKLLDRESMGDVYKLIKVLHHQHKRSP